jgi:hypothetical protein
MQKKQQKLDLRMRDEEAKLASERKKIQDRKEELEKKEREASKGLQVPPYWRNKTWIHFVATKFFVIYKNLWSSLPCYKADAGGVCRACRKRIFVANVSVEEGHSQEKVCSTGHSLALHGHQLAACDSKQG